MKQQYCVYNGFDKRSLMDVENKVEVKIHYAEGLLKQLILLLQGVSDQDDPMVTTQRQN